MMEESPDGLLSKNYVHRACIVPIPYGRLFWLYRLWYRLYHSLKFSVIGKWAILFKVKDSETFFVITKIMLLNVYESTSNPFSHPTL